MLGFAGEMGDDSCATLQEPVLRHHCKEVKAAEDDHSVAQIA